MVSSSGVAGTATLESVVAIGEGVPDDDGATIGAGSRSNATIAADRSVGGAVSSCFGCDGLSGAAGADAGFGAGVGDVAWFAGTMRPRPRVSVTADAPERIAVPTTSEALLASAVASSRFCGPIPCLRANQ